jgi:hypothetical protein
MSQEQRVAQLREKIAALLLEEVKAGKMDWWYISVADEKEFKGGYIIEARGRTEAWCLFHSLNWCPKDVSTQVTGPITEEMGRVPEGFRWRRLTKEEALSLK